MVNGRAPIDCRREPRAPFPLPRLARRCLPAAPGRFRLFPYFEEKNPRSKKNIYEEPRVAPGRATPRPFDGGRRNALAGIGGRGFASRLPRHPSSGEALKTFFFSPFVSFFPTNLHYSIILCPAPGPSCADGATGARRRRAAPLKGRRPSPPCGARSPHSAGESPARCTRRGPLRRCLSSRCTRSTPSRSPPRRPFPPRGLRPPSR